MLHTQLINKNFFYKQQILVSYMAKFSIKKIGEKSSIVMFKFVVEKLQKKLLLVRTKTSSNLDKYEGGSDSYCVPDDVKEGHFVVIAEGGEEPKRLVMPLSCLTNSTFLRLLKQSEEEYGYDHEGALTFPCRPSELERILTQQCQWSSLNQSILLQSY